MRKRNASEKWVIALAYFHRYGWIAAMLLCSIILGGYGKCIFGIGCLSFSVWSFVGYKRKWKHIYCSYQNAYHEKMTPDNIQWHKVKKSDAYGIPLMFFAFGLGMLILII